MIMIMFSILPPDVHSHNARVLMAMSVPLHVVMFVACNYHSQHSTFDLLFLAIYLAAALVQLAFVLLSAEVVVSQAIACNNIDPDNVVIPYLTSSADFLGSLFLLIAFDIFFATPCENFKWPLGSFWATITEHANWIYLHLYDVVSVLLML